MSEGAACASSFLAEYPPADVSIKPGEDRRQERKRVGEMADELAEEEHQTDDVEEHVLEVPKVRVPAVIGDELGRRGAADGAGCLGVLLLRRCVLGEDGRGVGAAQQEQVLVL